MPSQICGFKDGEVKWFDGGRLPTGWSPEDPALKKESIPAKPKAKTKAKKKAEGKAPEDVDTGVEIVFDKSGDVLPGDGDGTLKGFDPDERAPDCPPCSAE